MAFEPPAARGSAKSENNCRKSRLLSRYFRFSAAKWPTINRNRNNNESSNFKGFIANIFKFYTGLNSANLAKIDRSSLELLEYCKSSYHQFIILPLAHRKYGVTLRLGMTRCSSGTARNISVICSWAVLKLSMVATLPQR